MVKEKYLPFEAPEVVEDTRTAKEKAKDKRENFWYYNKRKVIFFTFVGLMLIWSYFLYFRYEKADYNIGVIATGQFPEEYKKSLSIELEKYGEDINGDGKVSVQIMEYVIGNDEGEFADIVETSFTRLAGEVPTYGSVIYMCDEENLDTFTTDQIIFATLEDGKLIEKGDEVEKEDYSIALKDTTLYDQNKWFTVSKTMYFAFRDENPKYQKTYDQSMELFQRMINDEPTEAGLKRYESRKEERKINSYESIEALYSEEAQKDAELAASKAEQEKKD